jgi:hypothetical protein
VQVCVGVCTQHSTHTDGGSTGCSTLGNAHTACDGCGGGSAGAGSKHAGTLAGRAHLLLLQLMDLSNRHVHRVRGAGCVTPELMAGTPACHPYASSRRAGALLRAVLRSPPALMLAQQQP